MSSALAQCSSPKWVLASRQEALGAELACPRLRSASAPCQTKLELAQGTWRRWSGKAQRFTGSLRHCSAPAPSSHPQPRHSRSVGPSALGRAQSQHLASTPTVLLEPAQLACVPARALDEVCKDRACGLCQMQRSHAVTFSAADITGASAADPRSCPATMANAPRGESLPLGTLPSSGQLAHLQACWVL